MNEKIVINNILRSLKSERKKIDERISALRKTLNILTVKKIDRKKRGLVSQSEILEFMRAKGKFKISDIKKHFRFSQSAAYYHLKKAKNEGILKISEGPKRGRNASWIFAERNV